jgi:hypothetical protein
MDPKNALSEAFQRLDAFFIEGIGTFRKVKDSARLDQGKVYPPAARMVLESGNHSGAVALHEPIRNWFNLDEVAAKGIVQKIAAWIRVTLQRSGKFNIPQIGEIVTDKDGNLRLETPKISSSFFGLTETDITLPKLTLPVLNPPIVTPPVIAPLVEKVKEAEKPAVEKVKPPRVEKPVLEHIVMPRKKRRAFPVLLMLFLVLLIGGGVAGYIFREEIKTKLTEWGVIGSKTDTLVASNDSVRIADSLESVRLADSVRHAAELDSIAAKIKKNDGALSQDFAASPAPGMNYLVIACVKDRTIAERSVNEMRTAGIDVTVLEKEYEGGFYKITTFTAANRNKVISEMVRYKDKYPESWIYPASR